MITEAGDNAGDGGTGAVGGQAEPMLPFDPADLVAVRVRPVDFARMLGYSKQSVSRWIKRGLISVGPDGRLDPSVAAKQLLKHGDPARFKNRLIREAAEGAESLRQRLRATKKELSDARTQLLAMKAGTVGRAEVRMRLMALVEAIGGNWSALSGLPAEERGCRLVQVAERVVWDADFGELADIAEVFEMIDTVPSWILALQFEALAALSMGAAVQSAGPHDS